MEENNLEKYTYSENEKDIMLILSAFEEELQERLQESKGELDRVKYYEKFEIKGIDFNNLFITTEKDVDGNISYHVYVGDASKEIIYIDQEGNIKIAPELEMYLGDDLNIDDLMMENEKDPKKLKGISEKMKKEDIQKELERDEQEKNKDENEEKIEEEQINEDMKNENGEDLEITSYRKIKDENFDLSMKKDFGDADEKGVAYSEKLNAFIVVVKKDGMFQQAEGFEPSKPTMKTVISINEDGSKIEQKVPHALIKTSNPQKEMSITIGQYGYIEAGTVDRLPCNERIEMQLRQQGEGIEGKRSNELKRMHTAGTREQIHEIAHEFREEIKNNKDENKKDSTSLDELRDEEKDPNERMIYSPDEERRIAEEAEKAKVSVDEFKKHLDEIDEGSLDEKIEVVHEEIAEEYGTPSRNR